MAHQQHHDQVCDTANYVWSTRDRLGYGATGTVYVGYNKVRVHVLYNSVCVCVVWKG